MTARILLVSTADPRCRQLEDLLADARAIAVRLERGEVPWDGPAPDLLVVGALGGTQQATELVIASLADEPELSVLVVDEIESWPETLRHRPGLAVIPPLSRAEFVAVRERLLERRLLLRERRERRETPGDTLAAAALQSDLPAVREMRMMLERQVEGRGAVVIAGEPGTLRRRLLRHALADLVARDEIVWVDDIDRLAPSAQGDLLEQARAGLRIAATATPGFKHGMRDGSLRSDLYYSIGGSPVTTVPLRMRPDDVDRLMAAAGVTAITEDAMARLRAYEWPGNLRELELVAEHARVLAGNGVVADEHVMVPAGAAQDAADAFVLRIPSAGMALEAVEREAIRQTLEASDANVAEAARRLAIERGKLRYRLRRYGLGR